MHHRWLRSQGGPDTFSNCVTLCAACHHWVHHNVESALGTGWLVASWDTPADIALQHWMWPSGPVRLTDTGAFDISGWTQ